MMMMMTMMLMTLNMRVPCDNDHDDDDDDNYLLEWSFCKHATCVCAFFNIFQLRMRKTTMMVKIKLCALYDDNDNDYEDVCVL